MRNISVTYSCVFFILFSVFHVLQVHSSELSSAHTSKSTAASLKKIKADTRRLKSKIKSISASIKLKESKRSRAQKRIFSSDKKIQEHSASLQKLVAKQAKVKTRLKNLDNEKSTLAASIASANVSMTKLIRAFHLLQANNSAKALINQENTSEISRMKVYHDYLIKEYLQQHKALIDQQNAFSKLNETLAAELRVLDKLEEKNRKKSQKLQSSYAQRKVMLNKLGSEIKTGKSKVTQLKKDQQRIEKLAKAITKIRKELRREREKALKKKQSSGMSFAKHKGDLSWPVKGRVLNRFGAKRAGNQLKWRGVLIETKAGSSVRSVASGQVVFADWMSGYGFVLIVEHSRGYMSLYAHNQQILVNVGDRVRKNQQVSLAGNSGRGGKPALYFEIRRKGKPVNPAKWMRANKSRK